MLAVLASLAVAAPSEPVELRNTSPAFLGSEFAVAAAVGLVPGQVLPDSRTDPATTKCGKGGAWCKTNGFDRSLNEFFLAPADNRELVGFVGSTFTLGAAPLFAFGGVVIPALAAGEPDAAVADAVIIVDAFLISTAFAQGAQWGAVRERPAFSMGRANQGEAADQANAQYTSFFSPETTWAFTVVSASSTLAGLRGYTSAQWMIWGGAAIGLTGGILRMSADMQWATDILVAATVGTGIGVGLPLLLHGKKRVTLSKHDVDLRLRVVGNGIGLSGTW